MNGTIKTKLKNYLKLCTVEFDVYNCYSDMAYLRDENGHAFATVDYKLGKTVCDDHIFINGNKFHLGHKQKKLIIEHIDRESEEDRKHKKELMDEAYDVTREQDLYN
jgi:uncharacterized protein YllA (UPF0747 family)